jgi:hypothetical protein
MAGSVPSPRQRSAALGQLLGVVADVRRRADAA